MADIERLKTVLRQGVAKQRKFATSQQIDEVARRLEQEHPLTESQVQEKLKRFGADIFGDPNIFAATDIDDIITVISQEDQSREQEKK
jgi:hypothetical protein